MHKLSQKLTGLLLGLLLASATFAAPVALNPSHPSRYVVVRGDTLWDIAARFLRDPWRWPNVWYVNPQIKNPHLIYPGDVISLTMVDGRPRLQLQRGPHTVKLRPQVRSTPIEEAIPTIPLSAVQQFLTHPYVLDKKQTETAPYVVHFVDEHILGGTGNGIYVRSIGESAPRRYDVVRPGKPYRDPDSGEILGYEGLFVGEAELQRPGDPATLLLTRSQMETVIGDRLFPVNESRGALTGFQPRAPKEKVEGRILSVLNGVSQIGQYNVVVLNKGKADGLAPGHVLRVFRSGSTVRDQVTPQRGDTVKLPDEEAGILMVFRTFDRVSFALVMYATRAIHVLDKVRNPDA